MTEVLLLARREVREGLRSKGYRIVLAIGFLAAAALVSLPPLLSSGPDRLQIGLATDLPSDVTDLVQAVGVAFDVELELSDVEPGGGAAAIGADESLDAVVERDQIVVPVELRSDDRGTTTTLVRSLEAAVRQRLALDDAGLSDDQALAVLGAPPLPIVGVEPSPVGEGERAAAALAGLAAYIILIGGVSAAATGVAEEKESRLVEILLLSVPPRRLLAGKLGGIFALSVLAALSTGLGAVAGGIGVATLGPGFGASAAGGEGGDFGAAALSTVGWSVLWLVPAIGLFNSIAAALGATAERRQDAGRANGPLTVVIVLGYLLGTFAVQDGGAAAAIIPYIPIFAATSAPALFVTDELSVVGAALSIALVVITAIVAFLLAARIYERSITETGRKVSLREAFLGR